MVTLRTARPGSGKPRTRSKGSGSRSARLSHNLSLGHRSPQSRRPLLNAGCRNRTTRQRARARTFVKCRVQSSGWTSFEVLVEGISNANSSLHPHRAACAPETWRPSAGGSAVKRHKTESRRAWCAAQPPAPVLECVEVLLDFFIAGLGSILMEGIGPGMGFWRPGAPSGFINRSTSSGSAASIFSPAAVRKRMRASRKESGRSPVLVTIRRTASLRASDSRRERGTPFPRIVGSALCHLFVVVYFNRGKRCSRLHCRLGMVAGYGRQSQPEHEQRISP